MSTQTAELVRLDEAAHDHLSRSIARVAGHPMVMNAHMHVEDSDTAPRPIIDGHIGAALKIESTVSAQAVGSVLEIGFSTVDGTEFDRPLMYYKNRSRRAQDFGDQLPDDRLLTGLNLVVHPLGDTALYGTSVAAGEQLLPDITEEQLYVFGVAMVRAIDIKRAKTGLPALH